MFGSIKFTDECYEHKRIFECYNIVCALIATNLIILFKPALYSSLYCLVVVE